MGESYEKQFFVNTLGGGTPYEVKVWYDRDGEMYFRGGWSKFAEDHDLHQGFFMIFTTMSVRQSLM
jgi:hypothetical protein